MDIQYGIYILVLLGAGISTVIFYFITKSKDWIRNTLFFSSIHYFVFSVIKVLLGNAELSLVQSFWDSDITTYIHYGVPTIVIAIIAPLAFFFIFRKKTVAIIEWDIAVAVLLYPLMTLVCGNMPNLIFSITFVIVFVVATVLGIVAKNRLLFLDKKGAIQSIKSYWMVALFPAFLTLFYFPNELYLTNIRDFYNPYYEFVLVLFVAMLIVAAGILFLICILPSSWIQGYAGAIFGISLCSYIQYLILNGSLDVMLGKHQEWEPVKFIVNALIWIVVIAAFIIAGIKWKKNHAVIKWGSLFVMAMLSVTAVTLIVQNISSFGRTDGELTHDGDLVLAPENNVLVFILDMYDYRFFETLVEHEPEFADPLHDFVLYDDVIARHPYTDFSIPYLLTGSEWHEDAGRNFQDYAYDGDTMLSRISNTGADIGVYTEMMHFNESQCSIIRNYRDDIVRETDIGSTVSIMAKTSLYKMMPFAVKENYFYDTSDMSWMVKYGELWTDYNDVPFYERIIGEGLSVDNELTGTFRFYHMRGAHYPFYLSEDIHFDRTRSKVTAESQAKGSMRIVYNYLQQLEDLGLYDDATIIITADHGDIIGCDTSSKKMNSVSRPILMVKKAGMHGDALVYNHTMVSHKELIPTILDAYGLDYSSYGPRLEDIDESDIRERYFGYYTTEEGVVTGYVIGNGAEVDNWLVD